MEIHQQRPVGSLPWSPVWMHCAISSLASIMVLPSCMQMIFSWIFCPTVDSIMASLLNDCLGPLIMHSWANLILCFQISTLSAWSLLITLQNLMSLLYLLNCGWSLFMFLYTIQHLPLAFFLKNSMCATQLSKPCLFNCLPFFVLEFLLICKWPSVKRYCWCRNDHLHERGNSFEVVYCQLFAVG